MLSELRVLLDDKKLDSRDVFWPDTRLASLLNEAQDVFCEETGYIQDSSSSAALITGVTGQQKYNLNPAVILVRRVELGGVPLMPMTFAQHEDPLWNPEMVPEFNARSPLRWRSDKDTGKIEFVGTVSDDQEFNLTLWRRSLRPLSCSNPNGRPEIPARWHQALLEYTCGRAQTQHDAETFNPRAAAMHQAEFTKQMTAAKRQFFRQHNARADAAVGGLGWSW